MWHNVGNPLRRDQEKSAGDVGIQYPVNPIMASFQPYRTQEFAGNADRSRLLKGARPIEDVICNIHLTSLETS